MAEYRLTLELIGASGEGGEVRLPDFLIMLEALNSAVIRADHLVSQGRSIFARIVDLRHRSPATVTVELIPLPIRSKASRPDFRPLIVEQLLSAPEVVDEADVERLGRPLVWAFKDMTSPIVKERVAGGTLSSNGTKISLTADMNQRLSDLLNPEQAVRGTVDGRLEAINLHGGRNVFTIYPLVGPTRVVCRFPARLGDEAIKAIGHRVSVSGELKYREGAPFPHAVDVRELEQIPPNSELPTIFDLRGIAPKATEDRSSEDFVRTVRNAWR